MSASRILLIIPLVMSIKDDKLILTIVLSILMVLSDYFDGFFARHWKIVSDAGKIVDPVADKICIASIGMAIVIYRDLPIALFATMIIRDILILVACILVIGKAKIIPVSNWTGKITVGVFASCFIVHLFNIHILKHPTVILSYIMVPISLISYGRKLYFEIKAK
jgi:CDP-diacylglycerol--glycerol-3-phosphate 3-phosphatidyltransferase